MCCSNWIKVIFLIIIVILVVEEIILTTVSFKCIPVYISQETIYTIIKESFIFGFQNECILTPVRNVFIFNNMVAVFDMINFSDFYLTLDLV